jgi:hypothetical protein
LDDADIVKHLEELSGRKIRTREDLAAYVAEVSARAAVKQSRWQTLKSTFLLTLLAVAAFQYYYIDVQLQILSQPTLTVFYPVQPARPPAKI